MNIALFYWNIALFSTFWAGFMRFFSWQRLWVYARLMRLERPVGTVLLAWSGLWGVLLAGQGQPPARVCAIILLGTFLMRSAGCVCNDLADRHFDGRVRRTAGRPLATGEVCVAEALVLAVVLLLLSFLLVCLLNWQSVVLAVALVGVVVLYPFCKRFFKVPQLVLGVAFASPILLAHTAILGHLTGASVSLFLGTLCWVVLYDTYYALVDREDDLTVGILSSAIWVMGREQLFLALLAVLALGFWGLTGMLAGLNGWYYLGLLAGALVMGFYAWQTRHLDRERCFAAFVGHNWVGAFVLLGFFLAYLPS